MLRNELWMSDIMGSFWLLAYFIHLYICARFDFDPFAHVVTVGKFQTNSNVSYHFSVKTILYGRIQGGANPFAGEEGQKKQGAKITLYTVLLKQFKIRGITLLFLQNITPLNCISIKWDRCYNLSILSPITQQTI